MTNAIPAIVIIIVSSLGWAAFDALRKALIRYSNTVPLTALLTLGQLPFFVFWAVFSSSYRDVAPAYLGWGVIAVSINVAASVLFIKSLELSELSTTIPFLAFIPVFATLFSAVLLGEMPTSLQIAGILFVVFGALVLNVRREGVSVPRRISRVIILERGSLLMMCVALLWSLGSAVDKRSLMYAHPSVHATIQCVGVTLALLLYLGGRSQLSLLRDIKRVKGTYLIALVVGSIGFGLQLVAIQLVMVSIVESVKRAIAMTLAVVNGRIFFGEPVTIGKVLGIVMMSFGVVLILL